MSLFEWQDVEALNAAIPTVKTEAIKKRLRNISVKLGMLMMSGNGAPRPYMTAKSMTREFPSRLKKLRDLSSLTQQDLGDKVGISKNSIYLYEAGENYPSFDTIVKLCEALKVTPNALFGWSSEDDVKGSVEKALEILE